MARVNISRDLLARMENKVKTMENAEIKAIGEYVPPIMTGEEQALYEAVWGQNLHLKDMMPKDWYGEVERINACVTTNVLSGKTDKTTGKELYYQFNFNLKFSNKFCPPPKHDFWANTDLSSVSVLRGAVDYGNKLYEIKDRWVKVKDKVNGFLQSCKSLNEAIKLWPDVRLYIDQDDLERLEKKTTSDPKESKAAEFLATMDTDELVGAAVVARMAGA